MTNFDHFGTPEAGPAVPALGADVHVWAIDLDGLADRADRRLLDPREQARAERFVFDADRRRYVAAHVALRMVLARYTGTSPGDLDMRETPQGKPYLAGGGPAFNLSHSAGSALVAVADRGCVGVDLEQVAPGRNEAGIARSLFAEREAKLLDRLDGDARRTAFYRLWVCREAVLKAAGTGLAGTGLEIDFDAGGGAQIVRLPAELSESIVIREFSPSRDQVGAVAWTATDLAADARFFAFSLPVG